MFLFLALGEEVGWMGYAYDSMEERWNATGASFILGMIWAIWHLPIYVLAGEQTLLWTAGQILVLIAWRFLMVWIYKNTGKSLFAVILFHTTGNVAVTALPILSEPLQPVISGILLIIIVVIILSAWDFQNLTRFRKKSTDAWQLSAAKHFKAYSYHATKCKNAKE